MDAIERLQRNLEQLSPDQQDRVLDSAGGVSIFSHVGRLKDSPNLNGDPVSVQQSLRDE